MLVPVVVRPAEGEVAQAGWKYELVAGFHRVAAAAELGLSEIPVVIRASGSDAAALRPRTSLASSSIPRRRPTRSRRCSTGG